MYVHIPMLNAMQVPTYARYLKDILNQKRPIPEMDRVMFAKRCSAAILDGLIGTQKFDQALCDLRATVSLPKVIYDHLNHASLVSTSMDLELADQSIRRPVGIVEDVPVRIRNSFIPVDFVVHEMDVCCHIPLILGRSFLSTAGATIDVASGIIKLNINRKKEAFTFKPMGTEQCNQVMVMIRLERNAMTPDKKPSAAENFSRKFSRHVKNGTSTMTSFPVAPAT
jgi:hypothetical protein